MDRLRRLRFVTERYPHLQGLRLVPLGVTFLISAAWRQLGFSEPLAVIGLDARYFFVALIGLALAASSLVGLYYRHQFGSVQPQRRLRGVVLFAAFLAVFAVAVAAQDAFRPIVSLPTVVIGGALGAVGVSGGYVRPHYLALAALTLLFAASGLFGVAIEARDVLLDNLIGVGLVVVGIGDQLLLRRTLQPVSHVEAV